MKQSRHVAIGLSAVIVAADEEEIYCLAAPHDPSHSPTNWALPFGLFEPEQHRTFERGLRDWVASQTGFELGFVEQLYTFGDEGRESPLANMGDDSTAHPSRDRIISIGYLALTPERKPLSDRDAAWRPWYAHFPWEDWRQGAPKGLHSFILPALCQWADTPPELADEDGAPQPVATSEQRHHRIRAAFGVDGRPWIEERALERYELLYEAGLVTEAWRDRQKAEPDPSYEPRAAPPSNPDNGLGLPMHSDHRRILATAMGRLRAKIKYRPVIFEMIPDRFTLSQLQKVVEALAGLNVHKQNFRRLLERSELVTGTGQTEQRTGGRPAELFRFRRESLTERQIFGLHVPIARKSSQNQG